MILLLLIIFIAVINFIWSYLEAKYDENLSLIRAYFSSLLTEPNNKKLSDDLIKFVTGFKVLTNDLMHKKQIGFRGVFVWAYLMFAASVIHFEGLGEFHVYLGIVTFSLSNLWFVFDLCVNFFWLKEKWNYTGITSHTDVWTKGFNMPAKFILMGAGLALVFCNYIVDLIHK